MNYKEQMKLLKEVRVALEEGLTGGDGFLVSPDGTKFILKVSNSGELYVEEKDPTVRPNELVMKFGLLSDTHIDGDGSDTTHSITDFTRALDLFKKEKVETVIISGDLTYDGRQTDIDKYAELRAMYPDMNVYSARGNHDCVNQCTLEEFTKKIEPNGLYFEKIINGEVFLFLGMISSQVSNAFSTEEMDWFEQKMRVYKDRRVFVIEHVFINPVGNVNGIYRWSDFQKAPSVNGNRFLSICRKYKNIVLCTGHSHLQFELQSLSSDANYSKRTAELCHRVHTPSCSKPRNGACNDEFEGSQGYLVEVYTNSVVLKGYDFSKGQYLPEVNYTIDTTPIRIEEETPEPPTPEIPLEEGQIPLTWTYNASIDSATGADKPTYHGSARTNYVEVAEGYKYSVSLLESMSDMTLYMYRSDKTYIGKKEIGSAPTGIIQKLPISLSSDCKFFRMRGRPVGAVMTSENVKNVKLYKEKNSSPNPDIPTDKGILVGYGWNNGSIDSATGLPKTAPNHAYSDFIPIEEGFDYMVEAQGSEGVRYFSIYAYSGEQTYIEGKVNGNPSYVSEVPNNIEVGNVTNYTLDRLPQGTKYIRFRLAGTDSSKVTTIVQLYKNVSSQQPPTDPEVPPSPSEVPIMKFGLLSDVHIDGDGTDNASSITDFNKALDLFRKEEVDAVMIAGDVAEDGRQVDIDKFAELKRNNSDLPMYISRGNNECVNQCTLEEFTKKIEPNGLYFEKIIKEEIFLVLGLNAHVPSSPFTDEELVWFEQKMETYKDRRVFVIEHIFIPPVGNVNDIYKYGHFMNKPTASGDKFIEICRRYKNAVLCTGHSHLQFELQSLSPNANYSQRTESLCHRVHIPSCARPRNSSGGNIMEGSQGYLVKVYKNSIELNGYDFTKGKYLEDVKYTIDTTPITIEDKEPEIPPTEPPIEVPIIPSIPEGSEEIIPTWTYNSSIHKDTGAEISSSSGEARTDFIEVTEGDSVFVSFFESFDEMIVNRYDSNKKFIDEVNVGAEPTNKFEGLPINIPNNCKYFRLKGKPVNKPMTEAEVKNIKLYKIAKLNSEIQTDNNWTVVEGYTWLDGSLDSGTGQHKTAHAHAYTSPIAIEEGYTYKVNIQGQGTSLQWCSVYGYAEDEVFVQAKLNGNPDFISVNHNAPAVGDIRDYYLDRLPKAVKFIKFRFNLGSNVTSQTMPNLIQIYKAKNV